MAQTTTTLISSGGLARRLGIGIPLLQKMITRGDIPPGVRLEGSGRRAWFTDDVPVIERLIQERGTGRRKVRAAA